MTENKVEALYQERLERYTTAIKNGKPDRVPIRFSIGEWAPRYAGYTLQEVYYDLEKQKEMVEKLMSNWDLDTIRGIGFGMIPPAMIDSMDLDFYHFPGMNLAENQSFQYNEKEYMKAEDYDEFIANPTEWVLNHYLPRISKEFDSPGSYRSNLALIKGSMAMQQFAGQLKEVNQEISRNLGFAPAIKGITKAPFDSLGDTLRGMKGVLMDIRRRPEKIKEACEALVPHNINYGLITGGGDTTIPVFAPLHRGAYPFLSPPHWEEFYWPTLKKTIEGLWEHGVSVTFFAEGDWTPFLERIAELPEKSIQFVVDQTDATQAKKVLGDKFCLIGGVPTTLLSYGSPEEVEECVKRTIDELAPDGGYVLDTGSVVMADARLENIEALIEAGRKYGKY